MRYLALACVFLLAALGGALFWSRVRARNEVVRLQSADDYFDFRGKAAELALKQLGSPSSIISIPGTADEKQYRYDNADPEYVVFLFEKAAIVRRVNLVKKTEWAGWSGHAGGHQ